MFHAYFDLFLQALAHDLPWVVGGLGAAGILGWSPLGRAIARALRDRGRALELEESLSAQLADLQRTLSEVNERLDVTEQRLLRLPAADSAKSGRPIADQPRIRTPA
jgi:hypothetical protein